MVVGVGEGGDGVLAYFRLREPGPAFVDVDGGVVRIVEGWGVGPMRRGESAGCVRMESPGRVRR